MSTNPVDSPSALFQSAIQRILPHRYPFLLVDRVTEFVPGVRIAGIRNFSLDDWCFQGTIVPMGVLLEAATQLGAILVLERPQMTGKVAVVLQIPFARLHELVEVGDSVRAEAEMVRLRENFGELRGTVYREGKLVAEGQMRFAITNTADLLPP